MNDFKLDNSKNLSHFLLIMAGMTAALVLMFLCVKSVPEKVYEYMGVTERIEDGISK